MSNIFKSADIAKRYGIPKPTAANWAKAKGTWRLQLYSHLEKCYVRELAAKAEVNNDKSKA